AFWRDDTASTGRLLSRCSTKVSQCRGAGHAEIASTCELSVKQLQQLAAQMRRYLWPVRQAVPQDRAQVVTARRINVLSQPVRHARCLTRSRKPFSSSPAPPRRRGHLQPGPFRQQAAQLGGSPPLPLRGSHPQLPGDLHAAGPPPDSPPSVTEPPAGKHP